MRKLNQFTTTSHVLTRTVVTLFLLLLSCQNSKHHVCHAAKFGGSIIDSDAQEGGAARILISRPWKLDRSSSQKERSVLDGERDPIKDPKLLQMAKRFMNGSTTIQFTSERSQLRSGKKICYFSTGEIGYWRMANGGTGGGNLLGKITKKTGKKTTTTSTSTSDSSPKNGLMMLYEDALLADSCTEVVEIEVLSNQSAVRMMGRPMSAKTKKDYATKANADGTHILVYQIPIDFGRIQKGALINDVPGTIRVVPSEVAREDIGSQYRYSENSDILRQCGKVGTVRMTSDYGKGLVDPTWGRGRQWFYKGRSKGVL